MQKKVMMAFLTGVLLCGCSSSSDSGMVNSDYENVSAYTKYLTSIESDPSIMNIEALQTDPDDPTEYALIVTNRSEDIFFATTVSIATAENPNTAFESFSISLVRPGSYSYGMFTSETGDLGYELSDSSYYTLDYQNDVSYTYLEEKEDASGNIRIDLFKDGTYELSDAESMIKREYAIAVLTGYMNTDYYFYDQNVSYTEEDSTIPDPATAVYYASVSYENREILIYSGTDASQEPISTLGME